MTVSSEGPAAELYPDSMGQYNILREVYRYDRPVYKHVDREDRFIIFAGKNKYINQLTGFGTQSQHSPTLFYSIKKHLESH